jgi:hypothetical protein
MAAAQGPWLAGTYAFVLSSLVVFVLIWLLR